MPCSLNNEFAPKRHSAGEKSMVKLGIKQNYADTLRSKGGSLMKHCGRRLMALLLSAILCVRLLPAMVRAEEGRGRLRGQREPSVCRRLQD